MKIPSYKEYESLVKKHYDRGLRAFSQEERDAYFYGDEAQKELHGRYERDKRRLESGEITEEVFRVGCTSSVGYCLSLMFD